MGNQGQNRKGKKKNTRRRALIAAGVITLVLAAVILGINEMAQRTARIQLAAKYKEVLPSRGDLTIEIEGSGSMGAVSSADFLVGISGKVVGLNYEAGDRVQKGERLFSIDSESLRSQARTLELQIEQQELSLQTQRRSLEKNLIYAPRDGVVRNLYARIGEDAALTVQTFGALCVIEASADVTGWTPPPSPVLTPEPAWHVIFPQGRNGTASEAVPLDVSASPAATPGPSVSGTSVAEKSGVTGAGVISHIYVREGQSVRRGQLLFSTDTADTQSVIRSAELGLDDLRESLREIQDKLEDNQVFAPMDGVLVTLNVKNGQSVVEGSSAGNVSGVDELEMQLSIDELDIERVQAGQRVRVNVDAFGGETIEGTVNKIAPIGVKAGEITTFQVAVSVPADERIKPGMNALAVIEVDKRLDVLMLPVDAVVKQGEKRFVRVLAPGVILQDLSTWKADETGAAVPYELREVTVGVGNQASVEIISGVAEGETVLIETLETTDIMGGMYMNTSVRDDVVTVAE